MHKNSLDWIVVEDSGSATSLFYLTKGAHIGSGIFLMPCGGKPILVYIDMERDNVRHLTDYEKVPYSSLNLVDLNSIEDPVERGFAYYKKIFDHFGVRGRVYFSGGKVNNTSIKVFEKITRDIREIEFPQIKNDIIYLARRNKTTEELGKIRSVADRTQDAFMALIEHMKGLKRSGGVLVENGAPFTIGMTKFFLRMQLIDRGLLDSDGMIVAQGADGGVPHNRGNDAEPVREGIPIVFDIYPNEYGGGFFFDMTRTYSFGVPSKDVINAYEQVRFIQEKAAQEAKEGKACKELEEITLEFFEKNGHATLRTNPKTQEGYVHSLGHGVGLDVHELPVINMNSEYHLERGDVFTIEPGLYYPAKGFGIRIEDSLYIDQNGNTVNLTHVPKDLIL